MRRDPIVLPAIDGNRCAEATVFDARSVTRKYNATEENIYKLIQSCPGWQTKAQEGILRGYTHAHTARHQESNDEIRGQDVSL